MISTETKERQRQVAAIASPGQRKVIAENAPYGFAVYKLCPSTRKILIKHESHGKLYLLPVDGGSIDAGVANSAGVWR